MKYELYIKDNTDTWVGLDINQTPAMNYQINNLAELKDRQMSYSQNIKLPVTPVNSRALGFVNVFEIDTSVPYEPRGCRLLCDGVNIAGEGSVLFVDRISPLSIECQIISGTTDLIEKLSNTSMADIDYNTIWNAVNVQGADMLAEWQYLISTVDKGVQLLPGTLPFSIFGTGSGGRTRVDMRYLFPAVPFRRTVEHLLGKQGYSLVTDLADFPQHNNDYITFAKAEVTLPFVDDFNGLCSGTVGYPLLPSPHYINMFYNYVGDDTGKVAYSPSLSPSFTYDDPHLGTAILTRGLTFTADASTKLSVDMSIDTAAQQMKSRVRGWIALVYTTLDGINVNRTIHDSSLTISTRNPSRLTTESIELTRGETLIVGFIVYLDTPSAISEVIISSNVEFKPEALSDQDIAYGDTINVLASLGFKNQSEFLKTFLQLYGLTMDIDHSTKTVYAYTMNTLFKRRDEGDYYDWTKKLLLDDDNNFGFRIPTYAQNNNIKLQDNTEDDVSDVGVIPIQDRTLEISKDLFTLPFEAGRNVSGPLTSSISLTIANLPVYKAELSEVDPEQPFDVTRTYSGGKAHLVSLRDTAIGVEITENAVVKKTTTLYPSLHIPQQTYVDTYYSRFRDNLLKRSRTVELSFILTAWDVHEIDFFRPVWLAQFRAFFYISKISNFIEGQPTKVALVCLGIKHEPGEDEQYYSVSALIAEGEGSLGYVTVSPALVRSGSQARFEAERIIGISAFVKWVFSDGTESQDAIHFKTITQAVVGTAYFERISFNLSALVSGSGGSAVVSNSIVSKGGSATWTATADSGYVFNKWEFSPGGVVLQAVVVKNNILEDITGTAFFNPIIQVDFSGTIMPKNGYWGLQLSALPDIIAEGVPVYVTCDYILTPLGGGAAEQRQVSGYVDADGWLTDTKPFDDGEDLQVSNVSGVITMTDPRYTIGTIIWS